MAAHITAASAGGPRFNPALSTDERRSIKNAVWLCQSCAKLIDDDPRYYAVDRLQEWKRQAEEAARRVLEGHNERALSRSVSQDLVLSYLGSLAVALEYVLVVNQASSPLLPFSLEKLSLQGRSGVPVDDLRSLLGGPDRLLFVSGESGHGKTTFLHQQARELCQIALNKAGFAGNDLPMIPFYVDVAAYSGNLLPFIDEHTKRLTHNDLLLTEVALGGYPIVLLCDNFEACSSKRDLLDAIGLLIAQKKIVAAVVASQPHPAPGMVLRRGITHFSVLPLTEQQFLSIIVTFTGNDLGALVVEELVQQGDRDVFYSPLLASLLGKWAQLFWERTPLAGLPRRRGALYRSVLTLGFLKNWQASKSVNLEDELFESAFDALSRLAMYMMHRNVLSLSDEVARKILSSGHARHNPQVIISHLVHTGFINRIDNVIYIKHASIRDYFSAEYIAARPIIHIFKSFSVRWHQCLVMAAALIRETPASNRAVDFMISINLLVCRILRVGSSWYGTHLLKFVLEFAADSNCPINDAKMRILRFFSRGEVFLHPEFDSGYAPFGSELEDAYSGIYRLLGRIGTPGVHDWLRHSSRWRRTAIHGIRQDNTSSGLSALVSGLGIDGDQLTDDSAVRLIFEYDPSLIKQELRHLSQINDTNRLRAIFHGIETAGAGVAYRDSRAQKAHIRGRERVMRILTDDEFFLIFFIDYALRGEDAIAGEAVNCLRVMGRDRNWLFEPAERRLLAALSSSSAKERRNAARALMYGTSKDRIVAMRKILHDDPDERVATVAIDVLLVFDRDNACKHMATAITRFGTIDNESVEQLSKDIGAIVSRLAGETMRIDESTAEIIVKAFMCAGDPVTQYFGVMGLKYIGPNELVGSMLFAAARHAASVSAKKEALETLLWNYPTYFSEYIDMFLASDIWELCAIAVRAVGYFGDECTDATLTTVKRLSTESESEALRHEARVSLLMVEARRAKNGLG